MKATDFVGDPEARMSKLTLPEVVDDEDSNMISSSGSSPALHAQDLDECCFVQHEVDNSDQVEGELLSPLSQTDSKGDAGDGGGGGGGGGDDREFVIMSKNVLLEPFLHQVGGHFPLSCLAKKTLCKPLNEREHRFYTALPKVLQPFVPRFEGTMKVEVHETDQGYIKLTGEPPPNFVFSRKNPTFYQQMISLHHSGDPSSSSSSSPRRSKSQSVSSDCWTGSGSVENEAATTTTATATSKNSSSSEVFCNPWALKCHRNHLKKLGLLSPPGPSSPGNGGQDPAVANEKQQQSNGPKSQLYLLLENLVSQYKFPCVLDLKIGKRQYSDDVSTAKKARKIAKSESTTSATLGIRLVGMQAFDPPKSYICRNKYYGRSLNDDTFKTTMKEFFSTDGKLRSDVIKKVVGKVSGLVEVVANLETFRFYTSSLLVTYDGDGHDHDRDRDEADVLADVRVIDFAHSTHKGLGDDVVHDGADLGFIEGLKSFVAIMDKILQDHQDQQRQQQQSANESNS